MELRRHASHGHGNVHAHSRPGEGSRGRAERVVLTAHCLVSGYRLRAWRALACLLAAVLVATVGLRAVGFTHDRPLLEFRLSLLAGAVTHVVNPPEGLLTGPGQPIRIAIGLLGPVLLGLALLVLGGRVKR